MREQPELVWGVIASMWVGNLMLLVINLPLIGVWVSMLKIPYRLLFPAIVLFCCIGTFGIANNLFNVWLMLGCALIDYFFIKVGVEPAPRCCSASCSARSWKNISAARCCWRTVISRYSSAVRSAPPCSPSSRCCFC